MTNRTDPTIRVVLRPDRRQEQRRSQARGGRRAADLPPFTLTASLPKDDDWGVVDDADRVTPPKSFVH